MRSRRLAGGEAAGGDAPQQRERRDANIFEAELFKELGVLTCVEDVEDGEVATRLEDAIDFAQGLGSFGFVADIVQREAGEDHIEAAVGEWEFAGVAGFNLDALFHALSFGVGKRGFGGVAGEILGIPKIDAGGLAAFEVFGRAD